MITKFHYPDWTSYCNLWVDFDCSDWKELHDYWIMPIEIRALPEWSKVKTKIPFFTINNTDPRFASTNVVFWIWSYTFNYNTRDSLGMAIKATYCVVDWVGKDIFKNPVTWDWEKKSATWLLRVDKVDWEFVLKEKCTKEEQLWGELQLVFSNWILCKDWSFSDIKKNLYEI